jgi:hypothetical protein
VLPSSSTYKQALHGPHKAAFTVDLLDGPGGAVLARDVPVFSGSIKADLTHRVTRSGTFTVGPQFWPDENADPRSCSRSSSGASGTWSAMMTDR